TTEIDDNGEEMKDLYDIIVVAGQSNAEGNGVKANDEEVISDKVNHLIDKNPVWLNVLKDGTVKLEMVYPTQMLLEQAHERLNGENKKVADFSETFAKAYIDGGYLQEGRKVLIVKTAVGGTGFARNEWGWNSALFDRLKLMTDYGLSLNSGNRVVALLWHQGEHDSVENAQLNAEERYDFYSKSFKKQMNAFRSRYGENVPIIAGEFADSWAELPENKTNCDAVEKALKDTCAEMGNAGVASSEGLLSNDQMFHNGDNLHFCADSLYQLGGRYFDIYEELIKRG
ncbi:MAG: hypothetical protein IJU83_02665, partial [Clostridia bacterium]|nr:hypothetical protein [Clostridia bacterium]